jgi:transcriptional regulator with XRE-family HTH domain
MKYTERIRSLREDNDFNQSQIADLLNVCQKTYSDYELGKTRIPIDSIIKLAKHYNVSVDYICGVTETKNKFPLK